MKRKHEKHNRYTEENIQFLRDFYPTKGIDFCSKYLKTNRKNTMELARRHGIKLDRYSLSAIHSDRKRSGLYKYINLEAFKNIQDPEMAYILGLLWADGSIENDKISIANVEEDSKEFLHLFLKYGHCGYSIYERNRYGIKTKNIMSIRFCSKELATWFASMDYHIKKDVSADKILNHIPKNLHNWWFRGLIDGDGYLSYSKKGMYKISITSHYNQDWSYLINFCKQNNINYNLKKDQ